MYNAAASGSYRSNGRPCNGSLATSPWERGLKTASGQVTAQCLWNACKALLAGMALILTGATMATVGYYADELSLEPAELPEDRSNATKTLVTNPVTHFHLSNLSYVGPVIMGVGGFVIVATCVMTFEARDSAAKVAPVRLLRQISEDVRAILSTDPNSEPATVWTKGGSRASSSSTRDQQHGLDDTLRPACRQGVTAILTVFNRDIQTSIDSTDIIASEHQRMKMKRSPSAPGLLEEHGPHVAPFAGERVGTSGIQLKAKVSPQVRRIQCLALTRQARSMDAPRETFPTTSKCFDDDEIVKHGQVDVKSPSPDDKGHAATDYEGGKDWQDMTMDLHLPDCSVTLKVEDESKTGKSMGTKRPPLIRQKPVDHSDLDGHPKAEC